MATAPRQRIEAYLERLYGYAISLAGDREQARDLVQDCALRALGASRTPADESAYRAWLFRILRNAFVDGLRRQRRSIEQQAPEEEVVAVAEARPGDGDLIDKLTVRRGLAALSPAHREIIALIDLAGFSYAEAAVLLDVAPGTVMSRLSRARAALLNAIEEDNVVPLRPREERSAR